MKRTTAPVSAPSLWSVPLAWLRALTQPTVATFTELAATATWGLVGGSLLLAGVVSGLLRAATAGPDAANPIIEFLGGAATNLVSFSLVSVILYLMARLLHGQGEQVAHIWTLAAFWPAINILLVAPEPGPVLWLLVSVYGVFISYVAMYVVHGLSNVAARTVALTPLVLGLLFGLCVWLALFFLESQTGVVTHP